MALQVPNYIAKAKIVNIPIKHRWDDANFEKAYLTPDEKLRNRIDMTSDRGVIAVSLGFAEWIAWRFEDDPSHLTLLQLIEASWAGLVDWRYLSSEVPKLKWKEWQGPVRGPICAAYKLLRDVIRLIRTEQFASPEAVCLSRLTLYVLPKAEPFKEWREFAIARLANTDPNREEDRLGRPIPREAIDPDFDYKPEQAHEPISTFLKGLDYSGNPFLASPERMKKEGFESTPYSY
jgi:hypothetical protein